MGAYTEMCEQARQQAYDLLVQHAKEVGANAVIGLHHDASEVLGKESATEVLCYGTAAVDRKSTRLNSSHSRASRMPSSA